MQIIRKISVIVLKTVTSLILIALTAVIATSVSAVYRFAEPAPFSGPDVYNPYNALDSVHCWKRANFHTHTRVKGLLNECELWPEDVYKALERFGYDIVTFSNHNELTEHPFDPQLQVNVYEHGYNLFKFHKLVFGSRSVNRFDHILPLFAFQRQFQMNILAKDSDFLQLNHPLRTNVTSRAVMEKLSGYQLIELDSGKSTENEYWDWALSAGHYSHAVANDDLHYPDRSERIAVRCNFLCSPSAEYEDIRKTLLSGKHYCMRVPDYGNGDWEVKYEKNRSLPFIRDIGMRGDTIYVSFSEPAQSIVFTGQDHTTLSTSAGSTYAQYVMKENDPYARITAYFPEGEVIYSNAFARYDSSSSESPFRNESPEVNIPITILFNMGLLLLLAITLWGLCKTTGISGKKKL